MPHALRILVPAALLFLVATACDPSGPGTQGQVADSLPPGPDEGALVDRELAATGERIYRLKGCLACHKIGGGRAVGPDLAGITRRRDYEWFAAIVLRPDSMLATDTTARRLLREYTVPMPDQRVRPEQVRALWEYLRSEG